MKKCIPIVMLFISIIPSMAQSKQDLLKSFEKDFLSNEWPVVIQAKEKIENLGSAGIPDLLTIMDDCRINKLRNTGDLIYPGAERFFGHGQIIEYDIDMNCIRSGWLLEEITFMNFGFSGVHLPAGELAGFINRNFPEYVSKDENQSRINELDEQGKRYLIRDLSIEKAKNWWQSNSKQWTRLNSLEQALYSTDEKQQVKALFYMRNGVTTCNGLTQKYYKNKLARVVEKLSKSETGRVSENAKLIMLDSDFGWLEIKPHLN